METIQQNGPGNQKIDLVFCGDGYTKGQRKELRKTVDTLLAELWAISPFTECKREFNVYLVYLDSPPGRAGARYGEFLLGSSKPAGDLSDFVKLQYPQRVDSVVANAPACDVSVVVTALDGRSHSGRHVVVSALSKLVLAHELGHRLGKLGDEYSSENLTSDRESHRLPSSGDLPYANLTLSAFIDPKSPATIKKTAKWGHFLGLPGSEVVSAYQGGYYRAVDVWRPSFRCVMNDGKYTQFCPVCHEQLYKSILGKVGLPFQDDKYHRDFPLSRWK